MKASKEFIETLKTDFLNWHKSLDNTKKQELKDYYNNHNGERLRWSIFWLLHDNNNYRMYIKDLKDDHINTALKRSISIPFIMSGKSMMY